LIVYWYEKSKNIYSKYWNKKLTYKYKVPKISNKTDKGKWLNAFVNKFFVAGNNDYHFKSAKNYIKLKTTHFNIVNNKGVLVSFFKNLKKLKQHHFVGEVFNSQLVYQPTQEAA